MTFPTPSNMSLQMKWHKKAQPSLWASQMMRFTGSSQRAPCPREILIQYISFEIWESVSNWSSRWFSPIGKILCKDLGKVVTAKHTQKIPASIASWWVFWCIEWMNKWVKAFILSPARQTGLDTMALKTVSVWRAVKRGMKDVIRWKGSGKLWKTHGSVRDWGWEWGELMETWAPGQLSLSFTRAGFNHSLVPFIGVICQTFA